MRSKSVKNQIKSVKNVGKVDKIRQDQGLYFIEYLNMIYGRFLNK